MRPAVVSVSSELDEPLKQLRSKVESLAGRPISSPLKTHLATIGKSLDRIEQKLRRLKELKEAKSVPYVKDVRMIDLSE